MDSDSRLDHLERLARLRDGGALSPQEFQKEKERVLGLKLPQFEANVEEPVTENYPQFESNMGSFACGNTPNNCLTVAEAIADDRMQYVFGDKAVYYQKKFSSIARTCGIEDDNICLDVKRMQRAVTRKPGFNLWGVLLGPFWGVYRRLPAGWICLILLMVIPPVIEAIFKLDQSYLDPGIRGGMVALFGIGGNGLLLSRYLKLSSRSDDLHQIYEGMRPSLLRLVSAIALVLFFLFLMGYGATHGILPNSLAGVEYEKTARTVSRADNPVDDMIDTAQSVEATSQPEEQSFEQEQAQVLEAPQTRQPENLLPADAEGSAAPVSPDTLNVEELPIVRSAIERAFVSGNPVRWNGEGLHGYAVPNSIDGQSGCRDISVTLDERPAWKSEIKRMCEDSR